MNCIGWILNLQRDLTALKSSKSLSSLSVSTAAILCCCSLGPFSLSKRLQAEVRRIWVCLTHDYWCCLQKLIKTKGRLYSPTTNLELNFLLTLLGGRCALKMKGVFITELWCSISKKQKKQSFLWRFAKCNLIVIMLFSSLPTFHSSANSPAEIWQQ